ncbi:MULTISPECIES: LysR family transcriptional regulator [unclassified Paraburkholderia]|uniref:LysR family transcriptional regulator n=1 Tax=unclassified Paraburkholderia TaxID=2615204 RepID=UPI002AB22C55|nr:MULTISPECIES: LysR family transcriptional regulator [unclassified Paraburkholderia]
MESIRVLKYFLAIVDAGSVTGAAAQLGMAQPALSQAITRLETDLGVKLLARTRRGAALTPAGEAIAEDIRVSVSRLDAAEKRARDIGAQRGGRLIIGFASAALFQVMPKAIAALRAAVPNVELTLREMSNAEQASSLETGEIDIGLLHTPVAVRGQMREKLIVREKLLAVVQASHPLGADGKLGLADLARIGLVWFPHGQLPVVRAGILSAFRKFGCEANIVQDANRSLTVLACVAAGCGASLLPESVKAIQFEGVRVCEVREENVLPLFELSAIWPHRSRPTLADKFAALLGP